MNSYLIKFQISDAYDGSIKTDSIIVIETVLYTLKKGKEAVDEIEKSIWSMFENASIISIKRERSNILTKKSCPRICLKSAKKGGKNPGEN